MFAYPDAAFTMRIVKRGKLEFFTICIFVFYETQFTVFESLISVPFCGSIFFYFASMDVN